MQEKYALALSYCREWPMKRSAYDYDLTYAQVWERFQTEMTAYPKVAIVTMDGEVMMSVEVGTAF